MNRGKEESIKSKYIVQFLKTNSGKKGAGMPVVRNPQFNFKEGFCWNNVLTTYIKCRKKDKTVQSTESMTFFSLTDIAPEYFMICIMNSRLVAEYVDTFVNATSHCTTGDAKLIFINIPTEKQLDSFKAIFDRAYKIKKQQFSGIVSEEKAEEMLSPIQQELDKLVEELYEV